MKTPNIPVSDLVDLTAERERASRGAAAKNSRLSHSVKGSRSSKSKLLEEEKKEREKRKINRDIQLERERKRRRKEVDEFGEANVLQNFPSNYVESIFSGVKWDTLTGKWEASLETLNKNIFLGFFDSDLDAALACEDAVKKHKAKVVGNENDTTAANLVKKGKFTANHLLAEKQRSVSSEVKETFVSFPHHPHKLRLKNEYLYEYICDHCDKSFISETYQCEECGYDVCPDCLARETIKQMRKEEKVELSDESKNQEREEFGDKLNTIEKKVKIEPERKVISSGSLLPSSILPSVTWSERTLALINKVVS
eukprot:g6089.t1